MGYPGHDERDFDFWKLNGPRVYRQFIQIKMQRRLSIYFEKGAH